MERTDTRGQLGTGKLTSIIVAFAVAGLVFAFLIPVAVNSMEGDRTQTLTQDTSVETEVNAVLNSTVTGTTDGADATVELNVSDGGVESKTINVGENATYTFDRGDVLVTVDSATSTDATLQYDYPRDFAYSDGARGIWGLVSLAIVLAGLLMFIGIGMKAT